MDFLRWFTAPNMKLLTKIMAAVLDPGGRDIVLAKPYRTRIGKPGESAAIDRCFNILLCFTRMGIEWSGCHHRDEVGLVVSQAQCKAQKAQGNRVE